MGERLVGTSLRRILRGAGNALAGAAAGVLVLLVRMYQATLSPLIGRQCRFQPTCSNYFIDAVRLRGPLVGAALGLWRVLRCNPLCKGGYDPVKPARH